MFFNTRYKTMLECRPTFISLFFYLCMYDWLDLCFSDRTMDLYMSNQAKFQTNGSIFSRNMRHCRAYAVIVSTLVCDCILTNSLLRSQKQLESMTRLKVLSNLNVH